MHIDHYDLSQPDHPPGDLSVQVVITGDIPIRQRPFAAEFRTDDTEDVEFVWAIAQLGGSAVGWMSALPAFGSTLWFGYWGESLVDTGM